MWVRNGLQIKGQAMTYVQSHFCNSMIDPDIYLLQVCIDFDGTFVSVINCIDKIIFSLFFYFVLQVCASRLDPDYFISSVFER